MARLIRVGEALVGDGNEVAHIDLMYGPESGPVGTAFANGLTTESEGHTNLLAVIEPNLACKPDTLLVNKVTMRGLRQAVQHFGPAQTAVARAVADFFEGKEDIDNLVVVVNVFIHPAAGLSDDGEALKEEAKSESDKRIFQFNYEATKLALERAEKGEPAPATVTEKKSSAKHPFQGFESDAA